MIPPTQKFRGETQRRVAPASALLLCTLATACTADPCAQPALVDATPAPGTHLRYTPPAQGLPDFLAHPFPSDALRPDNTRQGVTLDHFPNPGGSSTLEDYLTIIGNRSFGFGSTTAIYLGLSAPLDPQTLPSSPQASLQPEASAFLVDIDPDSDERGRRYPLRFRFSETASFYLPENHLIALPLWGATLKSATTYALVLTDAVQDTQGAPLTQHPDFSRALAGCEESLTARAQASLRNLMDYLDDEGPDPETIAGATAFTTQDNLATLRIVTDAAEALPPPELVTLSFLELEGQIYKFYGELQMPSFQAGEVPYRTIDDGGFIALDDNGEAQVTHTELTRIGITIPSQHTMPEGGWPVVLYAHGTGGSYESAFVGSVSQALARQGIAVVGYDQTLHGTRDPTGSDPSLTFFNLGNPIAARDNVRQASADLTFMTKLLQTLTIPRNLAGGDRDIVFDKDRMAFFGHSQGSVTGAPWVVSDQRTKATVFSGLGAIFAITMLERKDIVDFEALLSSLLGFPPEEVLDEFHPVLYLMQMFIEPADPIGFARAILRDMPAQRDILMIEGLLDFASPAPGQEAFAAAAGLPVIGTVHSQPLVTELLGPAAQPAPASKNVEGPNGPITHGLIQYPEDDHFPVFDNGDANRRFLEFMRTSLIEGPSTIVE